MVFKVGDTVKITLNDPAFKELEGKYATIASINEHGLIEIRHVRYTIEMGTDVVGCFGAVLESKFLEPCNPLPKFSINDWDSIMEVIANGQV